MTKWLMVSMVILLVAGCGGDDKHPAAELAGKLQGGHVQGVDWRTPTHSGVTDANGAFAYLPGEIVTFTVGGVELGEVPGSPDITLFTLAGVTPPSTARALRRELDRAMRTHTAFTRAWNMDLLLLELDADGDPDNGLDVRNRQATLAGVDPDFDLPPREFEALLYRQVPDLAHNIPPWKPVAHLYESLGLHVEAHAEIRVDTSGSFAPTSQTTQYYADGTVMNEGSDVDGDGADDYRNSYRYDAMGRNVHAEFDGNGGTSRIDHDFDAHGDLRAYVQHSEAADPSLTYTARLVEASYDPFGRPTRQVVTLDRGNDGTIDVRIAYTAKYDARGNASSMATETDEGDDGVPDTIARSTYAFDSRNRLRERIDESDTQADGIVDSRHVDTFEYGNADGPLREVSEDDLDFDGVIDYRVVYTWGYDRDGNRNSSAYSVEPSGDGQVSYAYAVRRTFDRQHRVVEQFREEDADGDGRVESKQHDTIDVDDIGNERQRVSDYDSDDDGTIDSRFTEASEYGTGGERLATGSHFDFDGDGLTDVHTLDTVTHQTFPDGVRMLAQWYVRHGWSVFE